MYECGLVYLTDYSRVGADEFLVQNEKHVGSGQLKQISKAILRMSIAMGGTGSLGPTGPLAVAAQQCETGTDAETHAVTASFSCWHCLEFS